MSNLAQKLLSLTFIVSLLTTQNVVSQVNGRYYFIENDSAIVTKNNDTLLNPWTGGFNSSQISTIDLNGDAYDDLFVFDRSGDAIIPFIWDVNTNYWKYAPEYVSSFPELTYWAILRDYNCDGKKDIFSYVAGGVGVWKNTSQGGNISFEYVSDPYLRATLLGGTVANLYVSKVDIPDINDVDGDGDLDVLTFGIIGKRIEYYQNQSQELGYGCDSLIYEIANTCWGHFLEDGINTNACTLKDTCDASTNVSNPKGLPKHSGSTVLTLDLNDDGVRDMLLGDVSFTNIVALFNDNKGVNMNTSMVSQDTLFPSYSTSVDIHVFPASFYEDVDNDGLRDLLASPNTENGTDNYESIWYYKNNGTNTAPVFSYVENNFLQNETIEQGSDAYPVLYDYNNDGLLDLFIGNFGYYYFNSPTAYKSRITLYENTGTSSQPEFTWITDDFANISTLGFGSGIYPTFGDIDNDNDIDMIIGDYDGKIHLFKNSSGNLSTMTLSLTTSQMTDDNSAIIDVGHSARPQLFDIDNDNDLDLILGEENGNLNYYENMGNASSYVYRLQSETLGGIDISDWWTTIGNSIPFLFSNTAGETQLFVGGANGQVHHFNNIDGNILGNYTHVDTALSYLGKTTNAAITAGHLDNDTLLDLIVGNERGGLRYFKGSADISLSTQINTNENIKLYPNPTSGTLHIDGPQPDQAAVYNLNGQLILKTFSKNTIDVSSLTPGVYIIELNYQNGVIRKKFIRQ